MHSIDINADLGEGAGTEISTMEKELMQYISSANIACGYHAGSPLIMQKTIQLAIKMGLAIGAHPGYPDRKNFGRVSMELTNDELAAIVIYQVGALKTMVEAQGGKLHHVKPHGALYNDMAGNYQKAMVVAEAIKNVDKNLVFVGLANSDMIAAATDIGLLTVQEVFADRAYTDSGSLVSRTEHGAVLEDAEQGMKQVKNMVEAGYLQSISGNKVFIKADTVCVHGDNVKALDFVKLLHQTLTKSGIKIKAAHG